MRNIRLVIEYDGSRYDGWQVNPKFANKPSIQGKIESVLNEMTGTKVELIGALRTESGVHAYGQIANFITDSKMKPFEIKHYLNRYLPRDIAILRVDDVPEKFHASFNAKSFIYEYKINIEDVPSVFDRKYNYHCFSKPDVSKMKEAAKILIGKKDLKSFSDNKRQKKSTEREIKEIDIYGDEKEISISIHADDFWPNMARIIIGTLIEVGLGRMEPGDMNTIIESKDREKAGPIAEAKGLFLMDVVYE